MFVKKCGEQTKFFSHKNMARWILLHLERTYQFSDLAILRFWTLCVKNRRPNSIDSILSLLNTGFHATELGKPSILWPIVFFGDDSTGYWLLRQTHGN
jgi:hypothetical protein